MIRVHLVKTGLRIALLVQGPHPQRIDGLGACLHQLPGSFNEAAAAAAASFCSSSGDGSGTRPLFTHSCATAWPSGVSEYLPQDRAPQHRARPYCGPHDSSLPGDQAARVRPHDSSLPGDQTGRVQPFGDQAVRVCATSNPCPTSRRGGTHTAGRPETKTRLFFFNVSMLLQPQ